MASKPNRYKEMERNMTYSLCADAGIFVLYLICAGNGIIWLKVILFLLCMALSAFLLWLLYLSRELTKKRSLWITTGAAAILVCLLFSLILNFPSPNKYKIQDNTKNSSCSIINQI